MIAATPNGDGTFTLDTVAGNYLASAFTDGTGTSANFMRIDSITVDGCVRMLELVVRLSDLALLPPHAGVEMSTSTTPAPTTSAS